MGPLLLKFSQPGADRLPPRAEPVAVVVLCPGDSHALAPMDHLAGAVPRGFSSTGFMAQQGSRPAAQACMAWE